MTPADLEFTRTWWKRLVADEARLVCWLQKLQATELSGYADNREAAERWAGHNTPLSRYHAASNIFLTTGDDELRHSDLLVTVLRGRGAWPVENPPPPSDYWREMTYAIHSLETCAAVFHLGEHLAAERFHVLFHHPDTPADVMDFLRVALPDEKHHARIFAKLANHDALNEARIAHERAVVRLKHEKA